MFDQEQIDAIERLSDKLLRVGVKHSDWQRTSGSNDFAPSIEILEGDFDVVVFGPVPDEKYYGYMIEEDGYVVADDIDFDGAVRMLTDYVEYGSPIN